jgi:hypothetical protein
MSRKRLKPPDVTGLSDEEAVKRIASYQKRVARSVLFNRRKDAAAIAGYRSLSKYERSGHKARPKSLGE